jgi:hypothetical protein
MLTVNSPLRWRKPLVPSRGSTQKKRGPSSGIRPAAASSSARMWMSGKAAWRRWRMISSAIRSATVTGDPSAFASAAQPSP